MFNLHKHQTKIASLNLRAEKHGDDNVPTVDIKFETTVHSSALNEFDPQLRPLLFRKAQIGDQESLLKEGDDLIGLRVPQIKALPWDEEFTGYKALIGEEREYGENLELVVDLSKFKFEPNEGGAVRVTFNATGHPEPDQVAELYELIQETVDLTLTPPAPRPADLVDQAEAAEKETAEQED